MSDVLTALPIVAQGLGMTLKITVLAGIIGIVFGTLIGVGRTVGPKWVSYPLMALIEAVRGTPLYTQLLLVVFGLPQLLGHPIDEFTAAVLTIGLNSSAYVAEIFRGGIQSIDKGQMEAARSLGLSLGQSMRHVILPQAFLRVIPPLVNEMVTLVKESSLVASIALVELTRMAQLNASRTFKPFPSLLAAAMIYLALTLTLSRLAAWLERRLHVHDVR
jgi:His/Glu/Gln/Arg/opine family amino acid ABC transporter permease subunit